MKFKILDRVKTNPKANDHWIVSEGVIIWHNPDTDGHHVVGPDSRDGWFTSEELELDVRNCGNCAKWKREDHYEDDEPPPKVGKCRRLTVIASRDFDITIDPHPSFYGLQEGSCRNAFAKEAGMNEAMVVLADTGEGFACNKWEEKK